VSANELMITIGLLVAYVAGYVFIDYSDGWRYMFLMPIPVTLIWGSSMLFMPESPRWLLVKGREDEAMVVFHLTMASESGALREYRIAKQEINMTSQGGWSGFWTEWRMATIVSITLTLLAQFSGNACVLSYTPEIFAQVGMSTHSAILCTVFIGVSKAIMTAITIPFVDHIGRRPLLLMGAMGMSVSLSLLSVSCFMGPQTSQVGSTSSVSTTPLSWVAISNGNGNAYSNGTAEAMKGYLALGALCLFVASYSVGYGPICWLVSSEMFPDELRGRALGVMTIASWVGNLAVVSSFLSTVDVLGIGGAFVAYSVVCLLSFFAIFAMVPETMGQQPHAILRELHCRFGIS